MGYFEPSLSQNGYGKKKVLKGAKGGAKKTKGKTNQTKLRKTITTGTVLILLGGRFRGRRVIFLKQLDSGLLLVTGPYAVNGVPLRRVNQRFVIATSTKLKCDGVAKDINDDFFARTDKKAKSKKSGGEGKFFTPDAEKEAVSDARKAAQKKVDPSIEKGLSADQKSYLKARFSLQGTVYPHDMKF